MKAGTTDQSKRDKDLRMLAWFIRTYCRGNHGIKSGLCPDCQDLFNYAEKRRKLCPLDPKPTCRKCEIHCYKPEYREKIRLVMRYSGKRIILRGRLDLIPHYFF